MRTILATIRQMVLACKRSIALIWRTSPAMTVASASVVVLGGVIPTAVAWVAGTIVDLIVRKTQGVAVSDAKLIGLVAFEGGLLILSAVTTRFNSYLGVVLGNAVVRDLREAIYVKVASLEFVDREKPEFNTRLRESRNSESGPYRIFSQCFTLIQGLITLVGAAVLLAHWSLWAVVIVILAGVPAFVVNTYYAHIEFKVYFDEAALNRKQGYLEWLLMDAAHSKEMRAFSLSSFVLGRMRSALYEFQEKQRRLTIRKSRSSVAIEAAGVALLYCAYGAAALAAAAGRITIGKMSLYLLLFRQGQGAISSVLSTVNLLYAEYLKVAAMFEFLETPSQVKRGTRTAGPQPDDGLRLEHVEFSYPGSERKVLEDVNLHLPPGRSVAIVGENGAGKSTLLKLIMRLYQPSAGRITLDGLDLREWDEGALRRRMTALFQDFSRFEFTAGHNIALGDFEHLEDEARIREAAELGLASEVVDQLPQRYETQLGKMYEFGPELSGGQWQKLALSRAMMRKDADLVVLDEPTSAFDAVAEARMLDRFKEIMRGRMAVIISHRFPTARLADEIVVLEGGRIVESGNHEALVRHEGRYATMYALQASGFR